MSLSNILYHLLSIGSTSKTFRDDKENVDCYVKLNLKTNSNLKSPVLDMELSISNGNLVVKCRIHD